MTAAPAMKITRARPLIGWALDTLLLLDTAAPGALRYAHQASPFRRQAIFLTLSHLDLVTPEDLAARLCPRCDRHPADPLASIAHALMTLRVRDIVHALHPGVKGLYGALNRMGGDPMHPLKYRALVHMLSAPDQRRARVLRQLETISAFTLTALDTLDPAFLHPDLISRVRTTATVEGFNAVVDLIRHTVPGVRDEDLLSSLRALGPASRLEAWSQRWIGKAVFRVQPPVSDDEDWAVLRTGEAMQEAALRFRNCMRDKVGVCALGRAAFVEWLPQPAMIELVTLTAPGDAPHWVLEGLYGHKNGRVHREVAQAICRKLQKAGILLPAKLGHARQHNKAASLLNVHDFGFQGFEAPDESDEEMDAFIDEIVRDMDRGLAAA